MVTKRKEEFNLDSVDGELLDDVGRPVERNELESVHEVHVHHDLGHRDAASAEEVCEKRERSRQILRLLKRHNRLTHL